MRNAFPVTEASRVADASQPTTRRDRRSMTTARCSQPSPVRMAVVSATQTWLVREIPLTAKARRTRPGAGTARRALLERIQRQTAAANPYLPLWLVAPRIWVRPSLAVPRFDGSGRVVLQEMRRQ